MLPDKGLPTLASTCLIPWRTKCAKGQGRLPQGFGHELCGYDSGPSVPLAQPPEDDLPQGAWRHLAAAALALPCRRQALEVTRT